MFQITSFVSYPCNLKAISFKYRDGSDIDEAVANYKKAASLLDSKSVSPYFLKKAGLLLEQNDDISGAVEVYELAMDLYLKDAGPLTQSVKNELQVLLTRAQTVLNK